MPEPLAESLASYRLAFAEAGVASVGKRGLEADDVIATIASKAAAVGASVTILSTDKIFLTLLRDGIRVRDHFKGENLDDSYVRRKFGVSPNQLADFLALSGDRGNNIHGVPGIGGKTAAELLSRFATLDDMLLAAAEIEGKLGERLREHAETARLCLKLVGLKTDLELGTNLNELRYFPSDRDE